MSRRECTWTTWPGPLHPNKIQRSLFLCFRGTNWQCHLHGADTRWFQPETTVERWRKPLQEDVSGLKVTLKSSERSLLHLITSEAQSWPHLPFVAQQPGYFSIKSILARRRSSLVTSYYRIGLRARHYGAVTFDPNCSQPLIKPLEFQHCLVILEHSGGLPTRLISRRQD